MMLSKASVLMALMLAVSCYAQDSAAPDEELDDMTTGDPILDAIAELVGTINGCLLSISAEYDNVCSIGLFGPWSAMVIDLTILTKGSFQSLTELHHP